MAPEQFDMTDHLKQQVKDEVARTAVELTYRNGLKAITMQNPVLDVTAGAADLFSSSTLDILLEAKDHDGNVIGEAGGRHVNAATGTLSLTPGETLKVPLQMELDFEGSFTVQALNSKTQATLGSLKLKTNYAI